MDPVKLLVEIFRTLKLLHMAGKADPIPPPIVFRDKSNTSKLLNPLKFNCPPRLLCDKLRCFSVLHLPKSSGICPHKVFDERSRTLSSVNPEKFPNISPYKLLLERSIPVTRDEFRSQEIPFHVHGS
uniref:Uncharacterized protein n=1 Tax=Opuntia streptacantha TaxID=393608 RepID=A0A7C9APV9_OPUST